MEGGSQTRGCVPAAGVSQSGVTIATGFDLSQRSENDLKALGVYSGLIEKINPYLGAKSEEAKKMLQKTPLTISAAGAESIDKAVKSSHVATVKLTYDSAASNKKSFLDLPAEAQTVIATVSFQYGVNLNAAAPKFWKAVTARD